MPVAAEQELLETPVVRPGHYGTRVGAVEPGGAEFIPIEERHGRARQLFWTWTSPNLEFATVFVGVLVVAGFGLDFPRAVLAIVVGTLAGSACHGVLSAEGPAAGVPQMMLGRISFGHWGNILPAGLNAVTAGIGWFAVNSVSGAFAVHTLTHFSTLSCLLVVVAVQLAVAFFGHNLVHVFERVVFPLLALGFVLAAVWILGDGHVGGGGHSVPGAFWLSVGATFGYAAGWNPYASDYTRYLPARTSRWATGLWAGAGVGLSCVALEVLGAVSATSSGPSELTDPTGSFTRVLPPAVRDLTLLAIALGAVSANVLNIYSGALSAAAAGVRLPVRTRRAVVGLGLGAVGLVVAITALHDAGQRYESFLLVIAYWIGPWLGVALTDLVLRRGRTPGGVLFDPRYRQPAGPLAMLVAMGVSIPLFSNQTEFVGLVPRHHPGVGDLTFEVGFVLAAALYAGLHRLGRRRAAVAGGG